VLRFAPPRAGRSLPRYVALYSSADRDLVLSVRPEITDRASVEFKDQSEILGAALDPEVAYRTDVLPRDWRTTEPTHGGAVLRNLRAVVRMGQSRYYTN
jgi:hypothetical protein